MNPTARPLCSAATRAGRPCRNLALPGADPPLCAPHSGRCVPPPPKMRCTAVTRAGLPCRAMALPGLDPPRCHAHAPRHDTLWHPPRACSATTRRGAPCRASAIGGSDPPLCCGHAGRARPLWPPSRTCTARVSRPRRLGHKFCRARAIPGTDPPRCAAHAGLTAPPYPPQRACTARTASGEACRAAAAADTDPPLCAYHAGRTGFTLEHTHVPTYHGDYAIVPRRRFLQQWYYTYVALFGPQEIELPWRMEWLVCRHAMGYFVYLTKEPSAMEPVAFVRAMQAMCAGLNIILRLVKTEQPQGLFQQAFLAYLVLLPIQPEPPPVFLPDFLLR